MLTIAKMLKQYCKGYQLEFNTLQKGMPTTAKIQKISKRLQEKKSTTRAPLRELKIVQLD